MIYNPPNGIFVHIQQTEWKKKYKFHFMIHGLLLRNNRLKFIETIDTSKNNKFYVKNV